MSENKEERDYIAVNVPRKMESYFDELLDDPEIQKELELTNLRKSHSGLGRWIIRQFLIANTNFAGEKEKFIQIPIRQSDYDHFKARYEKMKTEKKLGEGVTSFSGWVSHILYELMQQEMKRNP